MWRYTRCGTSQKAHSALKETVLQKQYMMDHRKLRRCRASCFGLHPTGESHTCCLATSILVSVSPKLVYGA